MAARPGPSVLCLLALLLGGASAALHAQPVDPSTYRVGPNDVLQLQVAEVPDLNVERKVSVDGSIELPLLGTFPVANLTADQVADRLKALLENRYVQHATVDVSVKEYRSRPITILGAVQSPGPMTAGRTTLRDAIFAAGGLKSENGGTIYVLRRARNGLSDQVAISVDDLLLRADPKVNLPIFASDVINVPPVSQMTIYLLGAVKSGPLQFRSTETVTLLTAIARVGGLGERASGNVVIKRKIGDTLEQIPADYDKILAGKVPDVELKDGDIVYVKESFF